MNGPEAFNISAFRCIIKDIRIKDLPFYSRNNTWRNDRGIVKVTWRQAGKKGPATSYGLKAERNAQQMVRIPKGDDKSTSKVTWKPRQSSPVCLWKRKSAACPCMLPSHALIHRKRSHSTQRKRIQKCHVLSISSARTGLFLVKIQKGLFVCLFFGLPQSAEYFVEAKVLPQRKQGRWLMGTLCKVHPRDRWWECE